MQFYTNSVQHIVKLRQINVIKKILKSLKMCEHNTPTILYVLTCFVTIYAVIVIYWPGSWFHFSEHIQPSIESWYI